MRKQSFSAIGTPEMVLPGRTQQMAQEIDDLGGVHGAGADPEVEAPSADVGGGRKAPSVEAVL
jgi:hypothetical protein